MPRTKPPVVLEGCHVEQFLLRTRSMSFIGRRLFFRGDKRVGRVPRLAIARHPHQNYIMLLHCDARWNVRGANGPLASVREAKREADRHYRNLAGAWVHTGYTRAQVNRYWTRVGANIRCSMCRRSPYDVNQMIEVRRRKIVLCDICIRKLSELLATPGSSST
jgi:hypothetical protein